MEEKDIEQYFVKRVKEYGGRAYKFVSPGNAGVPDRIVLLPNGIIAFAELKAPGKKPRPSQVVQIARFRKLGQTVDVIDTKEGVDAFLEFLGVAK